MNEDSTFKKPNLIYDVGLHHGQDTDFYLKKGFDVVAFEGPRVSLPLVGRAGVGVGQW